MNEKENLGKNIKKYRILKDWEQADLANKIGLDRVTISRVENGKQNVTIDNLIKIAEALEISLEELSMRNPHWPPIRLVVSDQNVKAVKNVLNMINETLNKRE